MLAHFPNTCAFHVRPADQTHFLWFYFLFYHFLPQIAFKFNKNFKIIIYVLSCRKCWVVWSVRQFPGKLSEIRQFPPPLLLPRPTRLAIRKNLQKNVKFSIAFYTKFNKKCSATIWKIDEHKRERLANFGKYAAECLPKFVQKVQFAAGDELELLIHPSGVVPVLSFLKVSIKSLIIITHKNLK